MAGWCGHITATKKRKKKKKKTAIKKKVDTLRTDFVIRAIRFRLDNNSFANRNMMPYKVFEA